jgi:predicted permease
LEHAHSEWLELAVEGGWPLACLSLVLVAALPSASNVVLLAYRQGASQERIARIVMLTTAVSFLSFSVIKTLYQACH